MPEISKIDKIKNLAVFSDYAWGNSLEPFKRYNLVYGWTGSGKTALSRLFDSIQSGGHVDFPDLEYQITIDGKKYTNIDTVTTKVRVFNSDYVERNIKVVDGHANPIYVLGEKSQDVLNQIQKDEAALNGTPGDESKPGKIELRRRANQELSQVTKQRDKAFTQIAGTISAAWSAAGAIRNYRRPDAKRHFAKLAEKKLLSEDKIEVCTLTLTQSVEPELKLLSVPDIQHHGTTLDLKAALTDLIKRSETALATQVEKVAIDRLSKNHDISDWVEKGLNLHTTHESKYCEFCQQTLPTKRLDELANHFSDADKQLKKDIDEVARDIARTKTVIDAVNPYDEAKLYKQFRASYSETITAFGSSASAIKNSLDELANAINAKKVQTTEVVSFNSDLYEKSLNDEISRINEVLGQHNEITTNHESEQSSARRKIEDHYLSSIFSDIKKKESRLSEIENELTALNDGDLDADDDLGITKLQQRVAENRAKVSSAHKSCEQINGKLRSFFGRDEIAFEVKKDANGKPVGYEIMRSGKPAKNVSEGEKTAIAFAYFCIHLTDQEFSLKDGIIVVDDPISSLDSGLVFKVCAAIKKQMKNAGQLLIFTHNFDFFNHLKKWFINDPQICGQGEDPIPKYRFLMIQNKFDVNASRRVALIADLDPMLRDYESEYHYLFKKLVDFEKDNSEADGATLKAIYDYPTIARKLLECFLSFRVPIRGSFYTRILRLRKINKDIDEEDIEFVYNFVNSHSHLDTKNGLVQFDPTLSISGPEAIKLTLNLIEQADKDHFKAMTKAVKKH